MKNPPMRSPRIQLCGLYHFARLLDKLRLYIAGRLPDEYHANLGFVHGLDGYLCGFLGIDFEALSERVRQGGVDEEIAEWCFQNGLRPNPIQVRVWNEFARKFGWNDHATAFIAKVRAEDGLQDRPDMVTAFDGIDFREGRIPATADPS